LGGLNKALPPHAIEDEQLVDATNFYYAPDTGYLTSREGLKRYSTAEVGPIHGIYDYVNDGVSLPLLVTEDQKLHYLDANLLPNEVGAITGAERPSFGTINNVCAIASGGAIQSYDGAALAAPAGGPSLDFITDLSKRDVARIIGCGNTTYRDRMFACGVNDLTNWAGATEADAKYIDVGYKDGLDLIGIAQLFSYTMLFKKGPNASHRSIYNANLTGDSSAWSCPRYRRLHSALSPHLIAEIGDGILAVDVEGPKIISPAEQPTDAIPFSISPATRTIAGEIAAAAAEDGFIVIDPVKQIAMVKPSKNSSIFYCMDLIGKRWTYFRFGVNIQCGAYVGGKMLFGAADGYVYEYDSSLSTDNDVSYAMTVESKWFNIFAMFDELVKEKYIDMLGLSDGTGTLTVKVRGALKYSTPFSFTQGWWDWPTVNALTPAEWTEDLEKSPMFTLDNVEVVEGDYMSIALSIANGRVALSHLAARIARTRKN
jgi:hypothetical protein